MVLETSIGDSRSRMDAIRLSIAIDDSVGGSSTSTIDRYFEKIALWASEKFGSDQIVAAKEEFYWKMGKVFSDDPFFNSRMAYFLDHFIFQRPLEMVAAPFLGKTPYDAFCECVSEEEAPRPVKGFRHSLFEVTRHGADKLGVLDLLTGEKSTINRQDHESFGAIAKKDLFQGFVYEESEGRKVLSRGLVFHPHPGHRIIRKYVKKVKKAGALDEPSVLSRYAKIELRHRRHPHVEAKQIYLEDPR